MHATRSPSEHPASARTSSTKPLKADAKIDSPGLEKKFRAAADADEVTQ